MILLRVASELLGDAYRKLAISFVLVSSILRQHRQHCFVLGVVEQRKNPYIIPIEVYFMVICADCEITDTVPTSQDTIFMTIAY